MTPSEQLVGRLCTQTFLSPWSLANPRGKEAGKELCDVLVVCDPDVLVFSVKEIEYKETEDVSTGMKRWLSRAVDASTKQIHGAERLLQRVERVTERNGTAWLYLPPAKRRRTHRIAVALGSQGEIPISSGDPEKPFVHVYDEQALITVMAELDTITDFVDFLRHTEKFLDRTQVVVEGMENLLGLYLQNGRKYPFEADLLVVQGDIWHEVSSSAEFRRKKDADKESYLWDRLIEHIAREEDPSLTESHGVVDDENPPAERVTRIMARENRFSRRMLSEAFRHFHQGGTIRSRIVRSPSGVVYVFLATSHGYDRQRRRNELLGRMFIARGTIPDSTIVVGLATEEYDPSRGFSLDTAAYLKPEWSEEDQTLMEKMQADTGAFVNPIWSSERMDEYPGGSGT